MNRRRRFQDQAMVFNKSDNSVNPTLKPSANSAAALSLSTNFSPNPAGRFSYGVFIDHRMCSGTFDFNFLQVNVVTQKQCIVSQRCLSVKCASFPVYREFGKLGNRSLRKKRLVRPMHRSKASSSIASPEGSTALTSPGLALPVKPTE